jgi:methyl-accepting chemotaxis protein
MRPNSDRATRSLGIAAKILAVVGLLAVAAAAIAGAGVHAIHVYSAHVEEMRLASERAIAGERLNGLVNTVVIDSRGINMSREVAEAEKCAKPLLANLTAIEAAMSYWAERLPTDRRQALDAARRQVPDLVTLRTEMVQAGRLQGPKAADGIGNNDANRANRQALNTTIVALAAQNAQAVETLVADLAVFQSNMVFWLTGLSALSILCVVALAAVVLTRGVSRQLTHIATAMRRLADGVTNVKVTGLGRGDEVGDLAKAL